MNILFLAWLAYIDLGLDVGSSLAKQSHHLEVTVSSGCDQRAEPNLSKTQTMTMTMTTGHTTQRKRKTQNSNVIMEVTINAAIRLT